MGNGNAKEEEYDKEEDERYMAQVDEVRDEGEEYKDYPLDIALRRFLKKTILPDDAQTIEKILEEFAKDYQAQNEGVLEEDACFMLCFSLIMLNTDQHNNNILKKNKMTEDQFIRANGGVGLDPDFLATLYRNIKRRELKMATKEELAVIKPAGKK
eukprot:CAMPEP_0201510682 /NCGR_PEP_ID=MMETSP0161_2-20130828/3266_1 /ASSEMBLY_ACC=CAM_ASM_000251 /TAXON_ID=180227 /ORGANISM="Neoparamoeba aestuarina, Strain SoJaBio B1-5/56/2" /LENGTH=155 /DNA_ID=CAMNT_0047905889 /DNA_START=336 /DNA_END=803 /DNA_ORIENTATION=-